MPVHKLPLVMVSNVQENENAVFRGRGGGGTTTLPHPSPPPLLKNPGYATARKSLFDLKSEKHWPKDKFHLAK